MGDTRPRCRAHLAGRRQAHTGHATLGPGGLPGTAGAEGQQWPDGAVGAAHILLRQPEMVRHAGESRLPSGPVGDQADHAGGQDSRRMRGEHPVPDIAETIPRRQARAATGRPFQSHPATASWRSTGSSPRPPGGRPGGRAPAHQ